MLGHVKSILTSYHFKLLIYIMLVEKQKLTNSRPNSVGRRFNFSFTNSSLDEGTRRLVLASYKFCCRLAMRAIMFSLSCM